MVTKRLDNDEVRDGIDAFVYGDQSTRFFAVAPGATRTYNELLYAQRKLAVRHGEEESVNFHYTVWVEPKAKSLRYSTWEQHAGVRFFLIDSDLDRSHRPQRWAAGLLPIIPWPRFEAWYEGGSIDNLRFTPPDDFSSTEAQRCLQEYLFLLLYGWTMGPPMRVQHATRLLRELGFRVEPKDVRKALDTLVDLELAEPSSNGPPKGKGLRMWVPRPTSPGYIVNRSSKRSGASGRLASRVDHRRWLVECFRAFEPFCLVRGEIDKGLPK